MFDPRSRYYELDDLHYTGEGQRTIVYKSRRFLSRDDTRPTMWETVVADGDRPDLVAARTLRQPDLFWRVCDANGVMNPFDLTRQPGRRIRILIPGA